MITVEELVKAVNGELLCGNLNQVITNVIIDSRNVPEGSLFVPLIGEKVDAHKFVAGTLEAGAVATFTSDRNIVANQNLDTDKSVIYVADTKKALMDAAAYARSRYAMPIVGITGSVGKTTTKEMIAAALEGGLEVLKTAGNMNSQVGLSLMMFRIEDKHKIGVIEMGVSENGEMQRLVDVAKPSVCVVTNIGVSHIGQFLTQENICREKLNIVNSFGPGGTNVLIVNGDDPLLRQIVDYKKKGTPCSISDDTRAVIDKCTVVSYGISEGCDYMADNVITNNGTTVFDMIRDNKSEKMILNVLGIHNVYNALAAVAVADCYGIDTETAKKGLENYRPLAMRGDTTMVGELTLIDDTYNASPDSMKSSTNVLISLENVTKRIAIFADILELGEVSKECHYSVGEYIAQVNNKADISQSAKVDTLITVGTEARYIAEGLINNYSDAEVYSYDNNQDAIECVKKIVGDNPKAAIVVKGSRGMHTDEIVAAVKELR